MEKLYYEDRYLKEFVAEVEEVIEKNGEFHVRLNKTVFFPGGGGQWADKGQIEKIRVEEVYEEDGVIFHVLKSKPIKIHRVKCVLDWSRRLDGMQQHLGQHLLSGCFFQLFNRNTVSFHMGAKSSTVDIEGFFQEENLREAEALANEKIQENIEVELSMPTKSELRKLKLRRDLPKTNEQIIVIKIGDLDINACCGVHPKSTLDLGLIKIVKWEKHKGNTRIEFLAGKRAVDDYFEKENFSKTICRELNCNEGEAIRYIEKLNNGLKESQRELKELKNKIAQYEILEIIENGRKIKDITLISKVYNGGDLKHISKVAEEICNKTKAIVLFAIKYEDRANLIFTSTKGMENLSMNLLLKDGINLIDGKGGGSTTLAQGSGKSLSNLDGMMDYVVKKSIELI